MTDILTGEQIKAHRLALGLTQEELATALGYTGAMRRQMVYQLESGQREPTYLHANLILAMVGGYVPTALSSLLGATATLPLSPPTPIQRPEAPKRKNRTVADANAPTHMQILALWAAVNLGTARKVIGKPRSRRVFYAMHKAGLLDDDFTATDSGRDALSAYEAKHGPLDPKPLSKAHLFKH